MKRCFLMFCLLIGANVNAQEIGPENGSLILAGGGVRDPAIIGRFLDLAGGPDVPIVVIPTAGGEGSYDQHWRGLLAFKRAGASNLTVLHTYNREVADTDEFCCSDHKSARRLVLRWPPVASGRLIPEHKSP